MHRNRLTPAAVLLLISILGGCATLPNGKPDPSDRFERVNRSVYKFNTALDHAVLRPVARTYVKITPTPVRRCVTNFFSNFEYPVTIVNDVLQGKFRDGASDVGRFGVNTVVGIGGLFDPASRWGLPKHDEDFGQTLGKWGVPPGPYLMLPLLGPSTVRDAPARLVDHYASPTAYISDTNVTIGLFLAGAVDTRARLLDTDALRESAFDPYAFLRNAWLQHRDYLVHDGQGSSKEELKDQEGLETPNTP
jgi:phospholipid-binding lipoprotein MlaA